MIVLNLNCNCKNYTMSISFTGKNHRCKLAVEVFGIMEFFDGNMHSVFPVMFWISGNINPFWLRISGSYWTVCREPVCKRKDDKHRWTVYMAVYYLLTHPWFAEVWGSTLFTQYFIIIFLWNVPVFFPPSTQCGCIVSTCSADTQVRIVSWIGESLMWLFRHSLDLKREHP